MSLSRAAIVDQLKEIVGADRVITDETVLKKNSIDRFRKFPDIHGIYTLPIPAAVVKLGSTEQVSRVLNFMNAHKINGVPRTGASATEGGLETVVENSVVLDGSAMNQIINIDIENMQATAQCGVPLEVLENALREKGYTTGHSPQSKPLAQMGGLVATRSIGQFSTLYGAIEDMVVGLEAVLADGTVTRIKNVPRRAAGPDIRHIIIGNEGALCYITEVTVKIFKFTPENNLFYGYILEDMKTGFNILREIMVEGYRPSIARLYDAEDGTQHFTHFADGKCVLIFMAEGNPRIAKATGEGIAEIVARYPQCQRVDSKLIETWFNNLNWDRIKWLPNVCRSSKPATWALPLKCPAAGAASTKSTKALLTVFVLSSRTPTTSPCWAVIPLIAIRTAPTCTSSTITTSLTVSRKRKSTSTTIRSTRSSVKKPFASAVRWCTTTVSVNIAFTGANWNTAARGRCWKG